MTPPTASQLYETVERTWPPAKAFALGPWIIRDGAGGGKRVSAATVTRDVTSQDIETAERAMADLNQPLLFMIRPGDETLDADLQARGYRVIDPVSLYSCPVQTLLDKTAGPTTSVEIWPPLEIMKNIWASGGIGPARLAVMERTQGAKTAILERTTENAAGCAYVAIHQDIAMIHSVEVLPAFRRQGIGTKLLRSAALWAKQNNARQFALAVVDANQPANSLYVGLGMAVAGRYHYRIRDEKSI